MVAVAASLRIVGVYVVAQTSSSVREAKQILIESLIVPDVVKGHHVSGIEHTDLFETHAVTFQMLKTFSVGFPLLSVVFQLSNIGLVVFGLVHSTFQVSLSQSCEKKFLSSSGVMSH